MIMLIPITVILLFLLLIFMTAASAVNGGAAKSEELRALKERIRTLEKIVTDQDRQLRREIDGLG